MNYEKLTCSRELAQRMAELGICQDAPELFWYWCHAEKSYKLWPDSTDGNDIIAPTLPRMMEEILDKVINLHIAWNDEYGVWFDSNEIFTDAHLPNAIAKILIALAEQTKEKGNI